MATGDGSRTLWMGDLEPYMDEFFLLQAFDQMGETAQQVKLINSKFTGMGEDDAFIKIFGQEREISTTVGLKYPELRLPAGYCFVDFASTDSAKRAMLRLNGKIIPNSQPPHRFKLNYNNVRESANKQEFSLFVGELSDEVDDYILFQHFSQKYTSCHTAKVVLDSRGVTKGYGFVRFSEETDQQRALIEMQHTTGLGRRSIRVSLATPKREPTNQMSHPGHPGPGHPPHGNPYNSGGGGGPGGYYNNPNYGKMYDDYNTYCQQYYAQYYATQAQAASTTTPYHPQDDPNALEEPELTIDVDKYNRDYMAQSEEIFDLLEDSRWHPMDQWSSTVPATAR